MPKFSIRDLLWLILASALAISLWQARRQRLSEQADHAKAQAESTTMIKKMEELIEQIDKSRESREPSESSERRRKALEKARAEMATKYPREKSGGIAPAEQENQSSD